MYKPIAIGYDNIIYIKEEYFLGFIFNSFIINKLY